MYFLEQNLSLEKPKKPKSGKIWGHSRTLSRVEALGMVRMVCYFLSDNILNTIFLVELNAGNLEPTGFKYMTWGLSLIQSLFVGLLNR